MSGVRVWRSLLGLPQVVVERVEVEQPRGPVDLPVLVVHVRPARRVAGRCGICRRRARRYDAGRGRRRWRHLDAGLARVELEADAPRVACREHGVVVAAVPWARHGAGHTRAFDDTVAWLAVAASKSTLCQLMRIAWRTVGSIVTRVADEALAGPGAVDRFARLRRIGIDEISYKRGHKYLTVVVDHDTGRLVWAAPGRDRDTLRAFFDALGPDRSAQITHVSADGADWIAAVVAERCPDAVQCADPFHIVTWATEALDELRRDAWNAARRADAAAGRGRSCGTRRGRRRIDAVGNAKQFKKIRYALWKNPDNLTDNQTAMIDWVAKTDPRLHRGYLLKEGLRHVFAIAREHGPQAGKDALAAWLTWARRCRIPVFVALARRITTHRDRIHATLDHGLSNGLIESTNTKIRLLTRLAYGFKDPHALIALAMLAVGGLRPTLPGRA